MSVVAVLINTPPSRASARSTTHPVQLRFALAALSVYKASTPPSAPSTCSTLFELHFDPV
ncbi:hypothetical protein AAVH_41569, partial [Aphelenchoides avenae]